MGITEGDGAYDIEGWDSAAKTAALANVLMDARTTPQQVSTRGIARLTPARVQEMARQGKTVRLISRGRRDKSGVKLRVRAEVLDRCDISGRHAGNHEPDSVPHRFDGNLRHRLHRTESGADRLRRVQRPGECSRRVISAHACGNTAAAQSENQFSMLKTSK